MKRTALGVALIAAAVLAAPIPTRDASTVSGPDTATLGYVPRGLPSQHRYLIAEPVTRWDPCSVIGWRVRTREQPGALADVRTAFWRLGQATGLRFRFRGYTGVIPQLDSNSRYPADTQIVVAWVHRHRSTLFTYAPAANAVGAPFYVTGYHDATGPAWRIASGGVVIDSTLRLRSGYGWGITRGDLLLHELGHVMGLDHVAASSQMMHPVMTRARARYGAGDLAGLWERGARLGCLLPD